MYLSDFVKEYIFYTHIELDDNGTFIKLREPTTLELKEFGTDDNKNLEVLMKIFPSCIVDHSFENTDGKKATNNQISDSLVLSGSNYTDIITLWMNEIKLKKKTVGKLDK